jgi:hypothetical protein
MESMELRIGEERGIHLPAEVASVGGWTVKIEGMESAVQVRKLWAAAPYAEDDDEEEAPPPSDTVFMVRGVAPGNATLRFESPAPGARPPRGPRDGQDVRVAVTQLCEAAPFRARRAPR